MVAWYRSLSSGRAAARPSGSGSAAISARPAAPRDPAPGQGGAGPAGRGHGAGGAGPRGLPRPLPGACSPPGPAARPGAPGSSGHRRPGAIPAPAGLRPHPACGHPEVSRDTRLGPREPGAAPSWLLGFRVLHPKPESHKTDGDLQGPQHQGATALQLCAFRKPQGPPSHQLRWPVAQGRRPRGASATQAGLRGARLSPGPGAPRRGRAPPAGLEAQGHSGLLLESEKWQVSPGSNQVGQVTPVPAAGPGWLLGPPSCTAAG